MTGRVCVVGSFMHDLVARVDRRPAPGETVVGRMFATFLGGKGFNQAVAARRTGARTAMVGRVGDDDLGAPFLAAMAEMGIDAAHVSADAERRTGVGLPVVDDRTGENAIVVVPGANEGLTSTAVDEAAEAVADADVLLLQLEVPLDAVRTAARIARAAGTTVVLNPAPAVPLPPDLLALVDVLVPNEGEAEALLGGEVDGDLAGRLDVDAVVMTLGKRGAVVYRRGEPAVELAPYEVAPVDTTAAGDAFCGALAARLAAGDDLVDAARFANAAGALAVTAAGAEPSIPTGAAVRRLLEGGKPVGSLVGEE